MDGVVRLVALLEVHRVALLLMEVHLAVLILLMHLLLVSRIFENNTLLLGDSFSYLFSGNKVYSLSTGGKQVYKVWCV